MEENTQNQETNTLGNISQNTTENKPSSENQNTVFVGSKHLMNYVNSIGIQLNNSPEVIVKARGKFISKAVDIVEVTRRQNPEKPNIKDIKIGTEEYENEGKKVKVSTIDIFLSK